MDPRTLGSPPTPSASLTIASLPPFEDIDFSAYIDPELEHPEADPQELILTAEEIDALSQFSLTMDNFNPHYSTRPMPPSSPSTSSSTALAGGYTNDLSTTPLTEAAPSATQWGTPPQINPYGYSDQPQPHYNYPQLQPRSARSHTAPDLRYMVTDYNTQPRAGPMFPHLELPNPVQMQFPFNSPLTPLPQLSPSQQPIQQPMLSLYPPHDVTPDLQFQQQGSYPSWIEPSAQTAYPFPRVSVSQSQVRSHSYPETPAAIPSASHDLNRPVISRRSEVVSPDEQEFQLKPDPVMESHKSEVFTQDDIHVLKSLLSSGERVKWRYISSRLSSVSGRRATSATCLKKSKELFKLPSEKNSGMLGTSLPYVVHDSWDKIQEDTM